MLLVVYLLSLFKLLAIVYCFNEPCTTNATCTSAGSQCRRGHCLCPSSQFWAGPRLRCIDCPADWVNLDFFCVSVQRSFLPWNAANDACLSMTPLVRQPTRLLELDRLADFDFIQQRIAEILLDQDLTEVFPSAEGSLHVGSAYVGSVGQRLSERDWIYYWGNDVSKNFSQTSQMWCKQKSWGSKVLRAEPFFHMVPGVDRVGLSLRRSNDSSGPCLISTVINEGRHFICEIAGESGRAENVSQTILTTQSSRGTTGRTSGFSVTIPSSSNSPVEPTTAIGSSTTSSDKRWLWMLLSTAAVSLMIISTLLVIIICQCSQRTTRSNNVKSKTNTSRPDPDDVDTVSNISTDSAVTGVTNDLTRSRTLKMKIPTDGSSTSLVSAQKAAQWNEMESSLFGSV